MIPNNACTFRITAAAGTELAGASYSGTVKQLDYLPSCPSSQSKELYNPRAFFTHAALLHQTCVHCAIFPTAASRRSLGRVSVPVWLIILSDQLPIVALVSRYLTNKLMGDGPIFWREHMQRPSLLLRDHPVLASVSTGYSKPKGTFPSVTHPCATLLTPKSFLVRLACVKHAASVRSEPGSNSNV